MRISFVSQYYYPEPFSNAAIVNALKERGSQVEVLTAVPNYPTGRFYDGYSNRNKRHDTFEGVDINRVYTRPRGQGALALIVNYLTFMFAGSWFARFGKLKAPDVVFSSQPSPVLSGIPALVLGWRFKVPVVFWVQDIWPESATFTLGLKSPIIVRPLMWLSGWIYRRADLLLVQSQAFPPMLTRFGIPEDRIRVFPNTAPDSFKPLGMQDATQQGSLVPQDGFRIMFAGNIGESQDFDTIIETARILKDGVKVQWVIIGSGRDMDRVRNRVREEGVEELFHFLGRHPEEDMPKFFAHADALLVSLKDTPIFALTVPYKVQCYMACAKPIIASLSGEGARIIQTAGAGITAPASQPQVLADQIKTLIEKPREDRVRMAENGRAYFEQHYSAALVYDNLYVWLKEMVEKG